jgi:hypothetical protein
MHKNIIYGDNLGSVGQGNTVNVTNFISNTEIDASHTITQETKNILSQSLEIIEDSGLSKADKEDVLASIQGLLGELKGEKNPGRVARFLTRVHQVVPAVAAVLKGSQEICEIVSHIPNPFGG